MRHLAEYLPLALFLLVFFLKDIYWATGILMLSYSLGMLYIYFVDKKLSRMHQISLLAIVLFGGLTLILRNELFIKWKPSIANWLFAAAFLGSHKLSDQPLVEKLFGSAVKLKEKDWFTLSMMWIVFFTVVGIANLYVAYNFSTEFWVKFKVFGLLGATLVFSLLQGIWLMQKGELIEESGSEAHTDTATSEPDTKNTDSDLMQIDDKIKEAKLERKKKIEEVLHQTFPAADIDLIDESHLHAGHAGAKDGRGHYRLRIISEAFASQKNIQRHQSIYQALQALMLTDIHALSIDAKTPDEVFS